MIVGRSMSDAFVKPAPAARPKRALGRRALVAEHVGPISFSVAAGETLGLVGLRGAGHHTIGRAIFGETRIASGRLLLDGEPIAPRSPAEAMARGSASFRAAAPKKASPRTWPCAKTST